MYLEVLLDNLKNKPQSVFLGCCVFVVAVMGTSVHHAASTAFAFLVIAGLVTVKHWRSSWRSLGSSEKLLLAGFAFYAFSGVLAYINVQDVDEYIKDLERYLRFLLVIPAYLFARKYQVNVVRYLYAGVIVSGPFLLYVALKSYFAHPEWPAQGYYHHIIFGSAAMLNVGIMLAILLTGEMKDRYRLIIFISMICGFTAAILSQSRGVWLVIPIYFLIAVYYAVKCSKKRCIGFLLLTVLMGGGLMLSPMGDMVSERIDLAVDEVNAYYQDGQYISSLGTRLAMWDIAKDVWRQHPIVGTGPGDFDEVVRGLQKQGQYVGMDIHESTHNIYFQSLVNAGTIGFIAMMFGLFLVPLIIIWAERNGDRVLALSAMIFLLLFATVGLSESWTLRLPTVSVYIIYLLVMVTGIFNRGKDGMAGSSQSANGG